MRIQESTESVLRAWGQWSRHRHSPCLGFRGQTAEASAGEGRFFGGSRPLVVDKPPPGADVVESMLGGLTAEQNRALVLHYIHGHDIEDDRTRAALRRAQEAVEVEVQAQHGRDMSVGLKQFLEGARPEAARKILDFVRPRSLRRTA